MRPAAAMPINITESQRLDVVDAITIGTTASVQMSIAVFRERF